MEDSVAITVVKTVISSYDISNETYLVFCIVNAVVVRV